MRLAVLEGEQSLPDQGMVAAPLWQSLIVGPETGRASLFLEIWTDLQALFDIDEEIIDSAFILEQCWELLESRPRLKAKVDSLIHHGFVRLKWWELIGTCNT